MGQHLSSSPFLPVPRQHEVLCFFHFFDTSPCSRFGQIGSGSLPRKQRRLQQHRNLPWSIPHPGELLAQEERLMMAPSSWRRCRHR